MAKKVISATVTPLNADGSLDRTSMRRVLKPRSLRKRRSSRRSHIFEAEFLRPFRFGWALPAKTSFLDPPAGTAY